RDGDDAEYFETATENPLQHTANSKRNKRYAHLE
ncbi:hypothetical protein LEA_06839, partial [human gut metagenome]